MTYVQYVVVHRRSQEFVLGGALLRPERPKFEVDGREREIGSWGWGRPDPPARGSGGSL